MAKKNPLRLTKKQIRDWKTRIQDAVKQAKDEAPEAEKLINLYQNKMPDPPVQGLWVDVPKYFPMIELKKHQLFYKVPTVRLSENKILKDALGPQMAPMVAQYLESTVNELLSRTEINVKQEIHKILFDVLVPGGMGACKIGYRTATRPALFRAGEANPEQPTIQVPDPLTGEPTEQPNFLQEDLSLDIPVHEEFFWEHFSLRKLLRPADFKDTDYEKAPWLGMKFDMPLAQAKREFKLDDDYEPIGEPEDDSFDVSTQYRRKKEESVSGIEIWYRASDFYQSVANPEIFRKLVFINGKADPVKHEDHPHQTIGPDGRLTPDSQLGNPIHVLTIRDLTDASKVPSDAEVIRPLVRELSKGRSQMLLHRDRSIPMNWHDRNRVSPLDIAKWERGEIDASIPVDGNGSEIFGEIPRANMKTENFQFNAIVDTDIREALFMGSNQLGSETEQNKSATELSIVQQNSQVGIDGQRDRTVEWFLRGLERKLFPLVQRYGDEAFFTKFVGQQGWQVISQWLALQIPARLSFEILQDSGAHYDSQVRLEQLMRTYEFVAKDPNINRIPILKSLLSLQGVDPTDAVVEQLPEEKPAPPNISLRVSGDDLNPAMPQFAVLREVLGQLGVQISEDAVQRGIATQGAMQMLQAAMGPQEPVDGNKKTQHPGMQPKAELLSKRESTQGQAMAGNQMQGLPQGVQ